MSQLTEFFDSMHGVIFPFAGSAAPSGFLMCDGAAVSRTTYEALFAVIGIAYGNGDGTSTFNVPDLRGRVPAGRDDMGGVAAGRLTAASAAGIDGTALGAAGGAQEHELGTSEMPSHSHDAGDSVVRSNGTGSQVNVRTVSTGSLNTSSVGGNQPHNNVQPTLVTNFIIKI